MQALLAFNASCFWGLSLYSSGRAGTLEVSSDCMVLCWGGVYGESPFQTFLLSFANECVEVPQLVPVFLSQREYLRGISAHICTSCVSMEGGRFRGFLCFRLGPSLPNDLYLDLDMVPCEWNCVELH